MLSDFIRVSTQRNKGADFTLVPQSHAAGGLMVEPGGPEDKNYLILQAY